jgi:PEGA domain-containing protein
MVARWLVLAAGAALASAATSAARADDLAACNLALVRGQELARSGRLLAARTTYPACLRAECDEALRAVCANFVGDLQTRIPSLHVEARGPNGRVEGARVYVDGALLTDPASLLEVDPGHHAVRAEAPSYSSKEEEVVVAERERSRSITVLLSPIPSESPAPRPPAARPSGWPASVYIFGAASVAAAGSFTYFALKGKATENDLRASCPAGPCDSSTMRREYLAADISLGVAVVAAGVAVWIALTRGHGDASKPSLVPHAFDERGGQSLLWLF